MLRLYPPAPVTVRTLEEPLDLKVDMTQGPGAPNAVPGKVDPHPHTTCPRQTLV